MASAAGARLCMSLRGRRYLFPPALLQLAALLLATPALALRRAEQTGRHPVKIADNTEPVPPHRKCKVSPSEECAMSSMPSRSITLVHPDPAVSRTRCLHSDKKEYAFQVVPRNPNKVLIFFQGGGACWNRLTTSILQTCWRDQIWAHPVDRSIFRDDKTNPFWDHTLVTVGACAGDMASGNVTRTYKDDKGVPIEQRGYYNTKSALDWVKANFASGPKPELVIAGESAGAIAVQVWGRRMLTELPYKRVSMILDSYAAVFPPHFQGEIFKSLGVCETGILMHAGLQEDCRKGTIEITDILDATMRDFPDVAFAMINSKYDSTQRMFYTLAARTSGAPDISPEEFHRREVEILRRYNKYPNFISYLATSVHHTFTVGYIPFMNLSNREDVDKALHLSTSLVGLPSQQQSQVRDIFFGIADSIQTWLGSFVGRPGTVVRSQCDLLSDEYMASWGSFMKYPVDEDECEQDLVGKTFVLK